MNNILRYKDEIYAEETPTKLQIEHFELEGHDDDVPSLEPMVVNWDKLKGRWNEDIFSQFIEYAKGDGYEGGDDIPEEEAEKMKVVFYDRLRWMLTVLNNNRPRPGESQEDGQARLEDRAEEKAANARRNSRRIHLEYQRA